MSEPIYLETSRTWSFGSAIEWPGWCRHARGDADPLTELRAYGERYGGVLGLGGVSFEPAADLEIVEILEGDRGTEWGVPSVVPAADRRPLDDTEAERQLAILQSAWQAFDRAVAAAEGHELRSGPRGGGRDLPRLIDHCLGADKAYLSKLGSRQPKVDSQDWHGIEAAMRERAVETFRHRHAGRPLPDASRARELWPLRWYVRYVSWHTLVHAWEIEDRRID